MEFELTKFMLWKRGKVNKQLNEFSKSFGICINEYLRISKVSKVNTNTFPHRQHGRTGKQGLKKNINKNFNIWANYFSEKTIYKSGENSFWD